MKIKHYNNYFHFSITQSFLLSIDHILISNTTLSDPFGAKRKIKSRAEIVTGKMK